MPSSQPLSSQQIEQFNEQGFLVLRQWCSPDTLANLNNRVKHHLAERIEPLELEAELQYPGAPKATEAGDATIRRLKQAYDRDPTFADWGTCPPVAQIITQLLGKDALLVRSHHNCVMTKHPRYSSDSCWHQDLRYWRYQEGNLISAWLALGQENRQNGCLQVIPGSHRDSFGAEQFDDELFFRSDLKNNQETLKSPFYVELNAGDWVLFHCRLLHAATRNYTQSTKKALVFTYRSAKDTPIEGSRSAQQADIRLD